jgi:hypothetical protein
MASARRSCLTSPEPSGYRQQPRRQAHQDQEECVVYPRSHCPGDDPCPSRRTGRAICHPWSASSGTRPIQTGRTRMASIRHAATIRARRAAMARLITHARRPWEDWQEDAPEAELLWIVDSHLDVLRSGIGPALRTFLQTRDPAGAWPASTSCRRLSRPSWKSQVSAWTRASNSRRRCGPRAGCVTRGSRSTAEASRCRCS